MLNVLKEKARSLSEKTKETVGSMSNEASDVVFSIKEKSSNNYHCGKTKIKKTTELTVQSIKSNIADKDYPSIVYDFIQNNSARLIFEIEKAVGEYSHNKFRNPATKALIAMTIYALFPAPIQWVIDEDDFNEFFMDNSEAVFSKLGFVN